MEMIMSKFRVGDIVRFSRDIYPSVTFKIGYTFKVTKVRSSGNLELEPLNNTSKALGGYTPDQFELVEPNPVLTPEEVFEHLRKGTKMQTQGTLTSHWYNHSGDIDTTPICAMLNLKWRIKPEPEVIELNGKKYREIID